MKNGLRFLVAALLLALPAAAHAQLQLLLQPPNLAGIPGATLSYMGTVTNFGNAPVFLTATNINVQNDDFDSDDSPFLDGFFGAGLESLAPNQSYTGEFFTVLIGMNPVDPVAPGTFTVLGGPNDGDQNELATAVFSAVATPEPASLALLMGGLAVGLVVLARKTKG